MNDPFTERVKTDRRTRKTKKAIKSAFMSLVTKSDISKITVKEISDSADINRKTFYAHYSDIPAVVDEIENEIVRKLFDILSACDMETLRFNPYTIFNELTKLISEDVDYYHLLVNTSFSVTIFDKVKKMLKTRLLEIFSEENTSVDSLALGFALDFASAGMLGAYKEWFNSDRKMSLEELSKQVGQIVFGGLSAIMV